jgi:hypothetical protein
MGGKMNPYTKTRNKRQNATRSKTKIRAAGGMKSSREARRLIRAAVKQVHSQRGAARLLRLTTQAQLVKMLHGQIRDTPAMKAALARANLRAKKAWAFVNTDDGAPLDRETVCKMLHQLNIDLDLLIALCNEVKR